MHVPTVLSNKANAQCGGSGWGIRDNGWGVREEEGWGRREEGGEMSCTGGGTREEGWGRRYEGRGMKDKGCGRMEEEGLGWWKWSTLRSRSVENIPDPWKILCIRIRGKYFGYGSEENISDPDPRKIFRIRIHNTANACTVYTIKEEKCCLVFLTDGKTICGLTLENHVCFYYTFCVLLVSVRGYYGHDTIPRNQFLN